MKARVTSEFKALRNPKDKTNSTIAVGEIVEGALAEAAVGNGFGKPVPDDTPVTSPGKSIAAKAAPQKASKGGTQKKGRQGEDGGSGDGNGGDGEE